MLIGLRFAGRTAEEGEGEDIPGAGEGERQEEKERGRDGETHEGAAAESVGDGSDMSSIRGASSLDLERPCREGATEDEELPGRDEERKRAEEETVDESGTCSLETSTAKRTWPMDRARTSWVCT